MGSKELWDKVRLVTGKRQSGSCPAQVTVEQLNQHFAAISTDKHYLPPPLKATVNEPTLCSYFTEYSIFRMLDNVKPTAVGLDSLPHWFLKLAAPSISFSVKMKLSKCNHSGKGKIKLWSSYVGAYVFQIIKNNK